MKSFLKLGAAALALGAWSAAASAAAPFEAIAERKAPPLQAGSAWPQSLSAAAKAELLADLGKPAARISEWHLGQNTSWWSGAKWNLDADRVAKLKAAGIGFLRFPGGSSSDNYFWNGNYGKYGRNPDGSEDNTRMNGKRMLDTDGFIELCRLAGAQPMLTLNYGLARYGSLEEATQLAADWLKYCRAKGFPVRHVEVGNENYGSWESGSQLKDKGRLSGAQYAKDFLAFKAALRQADPEVQVGAVLAGEDDEKEWTGFLGWNRQVMPVLKGAADFYIYHEYFIYPFDTKTHAYLRPPAYSSILASLDTVAKSARGYRAMFDKYAGGQAVPIAFDEFNVLNGSTPQTLEAVSLVFTAGVLGESIRSGFACTAIWDWSNGLDAKHGGDHGMLAKGDPQVPDNTPRPSYYAYAAFSRAAGERMVQTKAKGPGLRAYASRFAGGEAGLVLINQTEQPLQVSLRLANFKGSGQANAWCASAEKLSDRQVSFNGLAGPAGGGGPWPLPAPYALELKGGKGKLLLPPVSVTGVVLH